MAAVLGRLLLERALGQRDDVVTAKAQCALLTKLTLPHGQWCTALGVALARSAPH